MSEFSITRSDDEFSQLALVGDWDIRHVQKLYDGVQELLALDGPLEIQLNGVTSIDSAVAQLLVALQQHCDRLGQKWRLEGSSPSLVTFLREMGFDDHLQPPSLVGSESSPDATTGDRVVVRESKSNV